MNMEIKEKIKNLIDVYVKEKKRLQIIVYKINSSEEGLMSWEIDDTDGGNDIQDNYHEMLGNIERLKTVIKDLRKLSKF